jgi:hypothetical protein
MNFDRSEVMADKITSEHRRSVGATYPEVFQK